MKKNLLGAFDLVYQAFLPWERRPGDTPALPRSRQVFMLAAVVRDFKEHAFPMAEVIGGTWPGKALLALDEKFQAENQMIVTRDRTS